MGWQVRWSEFDVEYIHIPGMENVLADGMSRMRWVGNEGCQETGVGTVLETAAVET